MKCIFCKNDSSNSKSVEHIISESLGNKTQILPKGVVCDICNHYFGNKIEKVVLEMPYFKSLRARIMIESKKGKIPAISGFTKNKDDVEIRFSQDKSNTIEVIYRDEKTLDTLLKHDEIYVPLIPEPPQNDLHLSKFIAKIAIEALAKRVSKAEDWQNDFVENEGLDELRNFARYGKGYSIWPYHVRRIYDEFQIKFDQKSNKILEKLNEHDFLFPDDVISNDEVYRIDNLYFVLAIMGIEYTINLTNAGLDRYLKWLSDNQNKSILQMEKNEFHSNLNL
ncbi:HNH endonuclease [Flavobacterium johnsoniae]|uniref:HNH endonuclease n=1 Tax=Flavobacterium johnsoniae TaxID=986 RepID=UPI003D98133A